MEYVLKVVSRKHEVFIITPSCVIGCSSKNTFKQLRNEFLNLATKVQKLMKLFKLVPVEDAQWHEKNTVRKKT